MKDSFREQLLETIGNACIVAGGVALLYVFVVIEIMGRYGQEANAVLRRFEIVLPALFIILGIMRQIADMKRWRK